MRSGRLAHIEDLLRNTIDSEVHPNLTKCPLGIEEIRPLDVNTCRQTRNKYNLPIDIPIVICSFDGRSSSTEKTHGVLSKLFKKRLATLLITQDLHT